MIGAVSQKTARFNRRFVMKRNVFVLLIALAVSSSVWGQSPTTAEAYNLQGLEYFKKGDYDKAIESYNQAISINPDYADAYLNRGDAYDDKGDYDKAIESYNQVIRIDPNNAMGYVSRGLLYYNKKDYDKVIADYNQIIRIDPNNVFAYKTRGGMYFVKKDYDNAIADYNKAIMLAPNDASLKQGLEIIQRRGKSSVRFPRGFTGTWKRDNFNNTLTFTTTTLKPSNQNNFRVLSGISGDSYTVYLDDTPYWITTITVKLVNGSLVISGDSGDGEDNWNGTWKKRN